MKLSPRVILAAMLFLPFMGRALLSAPLERSISTSRQFIVYGPNAPLRGTISDLAEETKTNLLRILQKRDQWKTPIIINLQFPQANLPEIPAAARHFSQTGSGLKLQLDLIIGAEVNALAIQRELLGVILLEMIYRRQQDLVPGTHYVQPPDWMVDGLLAAAPGEDRSPLVEAVAPRLASNKIMPLEEFLRQKPEQLDSPARLLYRAYSLALVQLLLDETGGFSRLSAYIDNLSRAANDPLADLKAQFPALSGADNIDKGWKSSVARLGAGNSYQLLTFFETQRKLDELLSIGIPAAAGSKNVRLENFVTTKASPVQAVALNRLGRNLMLLAAAANPVMRPIVVEYQQITQRIAAGKRAGLDQRLARLKVTHANIVARMNDIDDYMNWFEATQSNTRSGAFTDYLRAAGRSTEPVRRRRDALSVYLDALEEQFQN